MADLTRTWKYARFEPDLGNNRELPKPFWLKVKAGLTVSERQDFEEKLAALDAKQPGAFADFIASYVEMGEEPLNVNGKPVTSMREYCEVLDGTSGYGLFELVGAVRWFNSMEGARRLFSSALSGGLAFTAKPISESNAKPTAAP